MKDKKELITAEKFIKKNMMRFYSLYPSENHFFLHILSSSKSDLPDRIANRIKMSPAFDKR